MKRKIGIAALLLCACVCLGCYACGGSDSSKGKNPHIIIETDELEFVAKVNDSYTTPYAGVFDDNLDRVDSVNDVEVSITTRIYNPVNAEIATLNNGDTLNFQFLSAGIWQIEYSVDGVEKIKPATITVTVCTQLDSPTNIKKENGAISWDGVNGASGYTVSVNGKEAVSVDGTSFTSDVFASSGFYVSVVAKGDNQTWVDSEPSSFIERTPLKDGELSAFNDYTYELDVKEGFHSTGKINPEPSEIVYLSETECQGSTGGALKMRIKSGEWGWGLFKLYLAQSFDMSKDFAGIEIRYKVDSEDYLLNAGAKNEYTTSFFVSDALGANNDLSSGETLYKENNGQWHILRVTKNSLKQRKYVASDTNENGVYDFLQLNLYNLTRTVGKGDLYLDYIRVYDAQLASPQNARIENGVLKFDAVEGAAKYSAVATKPTKDSISSVQYETNETSFGLDKLGIDSSDSNTEYSIRLIAVSLGNKKASSDVVNLNHHVLAEKEIANFNNASYESDLTGGSIVADYFGKNGFAEAPKYESSVEGSNGGAVKIKLNATSYVASSKRHAVFTVNLGKAIDTQNVEGIAVRVKLSGYSANGVSDVGRVFFKLLGDEIEEGYKTRYGESSDSPDTISPQVEVTSKNWATLKITKEQINAYYASGAKQLYFAFVNEIGIGNEGNMSAYIDYIAYYTDELTAPSVSVDGRNVSWNAVDGATSYVVKVNSEEYRTSETSFTITSATDANVCVKAESSDRHTAPSDYSVPILSRYLGATEIAKFDNATYESDLVAGGAVSDYFNAAGFASGSPKYEAEVEGSTNGAVLIKTKITSYVASSARHGAFTVKLTNALDTETYDGIKIRIKYDSCSHSESGDVYFKLLGDDIEEGYKTRYGESSDSPDTVSPQIKVTAGEWAELIITREQLKTYYENGAKQLYFAFVMTNGVSVNTGNAFTAYLDYIEYYTNAAE